ncbi:hypothetical protein [Flavobacterium sp.]|uniref:hypothetical protein n=1 Tax=Flavobacterium sp. TaxID=239 RepID=UPI002633D2B7|nr:hypothetical protein [Flavobacterium sp.]
MKVIYLFFAISLLQLPIQAQNRKLLTSEEEVQEAVSAEVSDLFSSEKFMKLKNKKFPEVKGYIVYDLSIVGNGKVSTCFKVDSDIKNPLFINFISSYLIDQKFFFKLQKQQRYKVRYRAEFS